MVSSGLKCPVNLDHGFLLDLNGSDKLHCPHSGHGLSNTMFTWDEAHQRNSQAMQALQMAKVAKAKRIAKKR